MADVVLIHAGIADSRMWGPQLKSFAHRHRVLAPDLPGFGTSPETDPVDHRSFVRAAMTDEGIDRAVLVGTSLGGRVALELAVETPERVGALVLVGAGIDGHDWSPEVVAFGEEEETALARGDLDAAVDANLRLWLAGPRRTIDEVDPHIRELVREMQRDAFVLQQDPGVRSVELRPPASERLGEVTVPTLVLTGDEDVSDIQLIADRLAAGIPNAERATIAGAAHLPNLEQPDEFDRIVLAFLEQYRV
jgi:3-oxoadipate enol-lactonase